MLQPVLLSFGFIYNLMMHDHIPEEYRKYWQSYKSSKTLFHLTTRENLANIRKNGFIEPRDPSPKHWAGMKAIFLSDPDDPLYANSFRDVLAHVKEKHENLVRLHIETSNQLYKSTDPKRTFQVISCDPISFKDIKEVERMG